MQEFRKEYLGAGITAFVSNSHIFGTDAVLLADFAAPSKKARCCDLGSGCGIIPLLWCKRETGKITAVEIQPLAVEQIKAAIEFNSLSERLEAVNADLRELKGKVPFGCYDVVTMNPPYKASGAGIESRSGADKIARHETMCSLSDVCAAAKKLLNFGGRLCMCIRPERLCELFCEMRAADIEPKRLRLVSKLPGKAPWLALVEGRRGGRSGMTVEPELFVYGDSGEYSDEMKKIYGDYLLENRGENA
ncbi:MAG: tRNA1(Val) (adenine(37)-N6)-methyltransferase [Oscillospiraceae bacterium]|nr:tRNA1(Val) (adenine(37)-N6)-methyltransferase [Oscillospiraceae bacterium]